MYNRYIPQSDGSYCRQMIPDRSKPPKRPSPPAKPRQPDNPPPCPEEKHPGKEPQNTGGLFHRLLPGGLDTEDLIIILLLLLIAGDGRDDQNFALLTLGLYLFM